MEASVLVLAAAALACSLLRFMAPHVRNITAGRELAKPGMNYMEVGRKPVPIDGVWSPEELGAVVDALKGGDQTILAIGEERIEALIRAGCPVCKGCKKLFPVKVPPHCDRCGHEMGDKNQDPPRGTS